MTRFKNLFAGYLATTVLLSGATGAIARAHFEHGHAPVIHSHGQHAGHKRPGGSGTSEPGVTAAAHGSHGGEHVGHGEHTGHTGHVGHHGHGGGGTDDPAIAAAAHGSHGGEHLGHGGHGGHTGHTGHHGHGGGGTDDPAITAAAHGSHGGEHLGHGGHTGHTGHHGHGGGGTIEPGVTAAAHGSHGGEHLGHGGHTGHTGHTGHHGHGGGGTVEPGVTAAAHGSHGGHGSHTGHSGHTGHHGHGGGGNPDPASTDLTTASTNTRPKPANNVIKPYICGGNDAQSTYVNVKGSLLNQLSVAAEGDGSAGFRFIDVNNVNNAFGANFLQLNVLGKPDSLHGISIEVTDTNDDTWYATLSDGQKTATFTNGASFSFSNESFGAPSGLTVSEIDVQLNPDVKARAVQIGGTHLNGVGARQQTKVSSTDVCPF